MCVLSKMPWNRTQPMRYQDRTALNTEARFNAVDHGRSARKPNITLLLFEISCVWSGSSLGSSSKRSRRRFLAARSDSDALFVRFSFLHDSISCTECSPRTIPVLTRPFSSRELCPRAILFIVQCPCPRDAVDRADPVIA